MVDQHLHDFEVAHLGGQIQSRVMSPGCEHELLG